jgi:hypothetical protein
MNKDKSLDEWLDDHQVSDDHDVVRAELIRRGVDVSGPFPNKTVMFPANLELLYLQESPKLAAWVRYDTAHDLQEAFDNLTSKCCGPATEVAFTVGNVGAHIKDGNHRGGGL